MTKANNWVSLSLDWLNICLTEKAFAKEQLMAIINDKRILQRVRHKARSILSTVD